MAASAFIGVDNSREMLARAAQLPLTAKWVEGDIAAWRLDIAPDILFANASLQWVKEPAGTVERLFSFVAAGGALAVSGAGQSRCPLHTLIG
ncbi:MAG: methyltransferase domain-containing protein [Alphaproteobacteria bacterium]